MRHTHRNAQTIVNFFIKAWNWAFKTQHVVFVQKAKEGINYFEFDATPSIEPGVYHVKFTRQIDGKVVTTHQTNMTHHEWDKIRSRLSEHTASPT